MVAYPNGYYNHRNYNLLSEKTNICEPIERRGLEGGLHIWEYPDYSRQYIINNDMGFLIAKK